MPFRTISALFAALFLLMSCAAEDLTAPPPEIGDFRLGFNIVVAKNAKPVGPSREASAEEWEAVMKDAIAARLGRYQGEKLYHVGIGVDGYALAVPGVPVLLSPKSALVVTVNIWDDAAKRKINAEPKQFTVFERFSGETVIGSGLTQTREEQMQNLAANAARLIENWLVENKAWFSPEAVAARAAQAAAAGTAPAADAADPTAPPAPPAGTSPALPPAPSN